MYRKTQPVVSKMENLPIFDNQNKVENLQIKNLVIQEEVHDNTNQKNNDSPLESVSELTPLQKEENGIQEKEIVKFTIENGQNEAKVIDIPKNIIEQDPNTPPIIEKIGVFINSDTTAEFAMICSFIEQFSVSAELPDLTNFVELRSILEESTINERLVIFLLHLIKKIRKVNISVSKWQLNLKRIVQHNMPHFTKLIEKQLFENLPLLKKLCIIRGMMELLFTRYKKFANILNLNKEKIKSLPMGRDLYGNLYWVMVDNQRNLLIFKENINFSIEIVCNSMFGLDFLVKEIKFQTFKSDPFFKIVSLNSDDEKVLVNVKKEKENGVKKKIKKQNNVKEEKLKFDSKNIPELKIKLEPPNLENLTKKKILIEKVDKSEESKKIKELKEIVPVKTEPKDKITVKIEKPKTTKELTRESMPRSNVTRRSVRLAALKTVENPIESPLPPKKKTKQKILLKSPSKPKQLKRDISFSESELNESDSSAERYATNKRSNKHKKGLLNFRNRMKHLRDKNIIEFSKSSTNDVKVVSKPKQLHRYGRPVWLKMLEDEYLENDARYQNHYDSSDHDSFKCDSDFDFDSQVLDVNVSKFVYNSERIDQLLYEKLHCIDDYNKSIESLCCNRCDRLEKPLTIIICDTCKDMYHMKCIQPILHVVPSEYWICQNCDRNLLIQNLNHFSMSVNETTRKANIMKKRKARLEFVQMSMENLVPKKIKKPNKEYLFDDDCVMRSNRVKKQVNYKFDDYDKMIDSALDQPVKSNSNVNYGHGKVERELSDKDTDYRGKSDCESTSSENSFDSYRCSLRTRRPIIDFINDNSEDDVYDPKGSRRTKKIKSRNTRRTRRRIIESEEEPMSDLSNDSSVSSKMSLHDSTENSAAESEKHSTIEKTQSDAHSQVSDTSNMSGISKQKKRIISESEEDEKNEI